MAIFQGLCISPLVQTPPTAFNSCSGSNNSLPLLDGTLHLINTTTNGKRYALINTTYTINVGLFSGTPYEAGYAYGQLFSAEITGCVDAMVTYIVTWIKEGLHEMYPTWTWLKYIPYKEFFEGAVDVEYLDTYFYTPDLYAQEMKGMADGSGVNYKSLVRINLFPEIIKAACSIIGAWGPATPNGQLVQVRALDWSYNAPMENWPMIAVYNLTTPGSNKFANIGWAGLVGSLAGFSEKIAVCEKVNMPETGDTKLIGKPWMYVLRDALNYANNLSDAIEIIGSAKKTCQLFLGVGSLDDNEAVLMGYNPHSFYVWTDQNFTNNTAAHPQLDGVVYIDKYEQPSAHPCLGSTLSQGYGELDAEYMFRVAAPNSQTGDAMLVVYDFGNQITYVAYPDVANGVPAYQRAMTPINMTELFNSF